MVSYVPAPTGDVTRFCVFAVTVFLLLHFSPLPLYLARSDWLRMPFMILNRIDRAKMLLVPHGVVLE